MISIESTGKNVQKAIEAGLAKLGQANDDNVEVRVISTGGLFKKARVELTLVENEKIRAYVKEEARADFNNETKKEVSNGKLDNKQNKSENKFDNKQVKTESKLENKQNKSESKFDNKQVKTENKFENKQNKSENKLENKQVKSENKQENRFENKQANRSESTQDRHDNRYNNKPFNKEDNKHLDNAKPERKPFTRDGFKPSLQQNQQQKEAVRQDRSEQKETSKEFYHERPRTPITEDITKQALDFVSTLLTKMDMDFALSSSESEGELNIAIKSENGILIGYHGETLDAIEYITSLAINNNDDRYYRINIDCNEYRIKRVETLTTLANRMAEKALKTGRKVVLDPMNSSSRKVIHSVLGENERIITKSEGKDPARRIIIIPKRY